MLASEERAKSHLATSQFNNMRIFEAYQPKSYLADFQRLNISTRFCPLIIGYYRIESIQPINKFIFCVRKDLIYIIAL